MDLVKKILFAMEEEPSGFARHSESKIAGYSQETIGYHVLIMIEAGLVKGDDVSDYFPTPCAMATRLTWLGHEFLDACREETRWNKAKEIVGKLGGVTFDVFKQILTKLMVDQVTKAIP
jgi:hypothetical protein